MNMSGWGNFPVIDATVHTFQTADELRAILSNTDQCIARGLGRSYGDSSLASTMISTRRFNRMLELDDASGLLTVEAGVSLEEILSIAIPRGWFLPVTPGTKFVTIGGAIASDIHGKNHHIAGSFSQHVVWLDIMLADGSIQRCSTEISPNLFWSTCGGMGLTGIVLRAQIRLIPIETSFIKQERIKARDLTEIIELLDTTGDRTYSVAWIDCLSQGRNLGRSILLLGEHATLEDIRNTSFAKQQLLVAQPRLRPIPINFPNWALNAATGKAFNALYYRKALAKRKIELIPYEPYFYPLDSVGHWNRVYGKRGFTQYQFVVPVDAGQDALQKILATIAGSGQGAFLSVLKRFGAQRGLISFPKEGYTLTLDFPITDKLFSLLDSLDAMVLDYGGRVYLAKDVRMSSVMFRDSYAHSTAFFEHKRHFDAANKFQSLQSKRIGA